MTFLTTVGDPHLCLLNVQLSDRLKGVVRVRVSSRS